MGFLDRMSVAERVDAQSMAVWTATSLGDLEVAEQISRSALADLQPGQAPSMTLHLVTWRTVALYLSGRWDEALVMAQRAERLWIDIGRPATLYAIRGLLCALDISRSRRDTEGTDHWRAVLEAISAQATTSDFMRELDALYLANEIPKVAEKMRTRPAFGYPERYATAIRLCNDHSVPIDEHALSQWVQRAVGEETAILELEARRALAIVRGDAEEARHALEIAERCGAVPVIARLRCEIGLMTGDHLLYEAGAKVLESLGDIDQLERYESRRAGRADSGS
jgi:hypothetical protein